LECVLLANEQWNLQSACRNSITETSLIGRLLTDCSRLQQLKFDVELATHDQTEQR
jgi:hypothetical protein